jgi:hypothetical protein
MFIIALLLGAILVPLATQVEERQIAETQKKQDEIKEALIGFVVANGYLPCPAVSATDGSESARTPLAGPPPTNRCNARSGFLPWQALGTHKSDAWGRLFRYNVSPAFTDTTPPVPAFSLATAPDIVIAGLTNATSVTAIVVSHGKNGYGGTDEAGTPVADPSDGWAAHPDENTNAQIATTTFISRLPQAKGASGAGGEFDDIVTWVPRYVLLNRMVTAGKLP